MIQNFAFTLPWSIYFFLNSIVTVTFSQRPYIILTSREQPDLNYWNPLIVQEMRDILQFWTDRRVPLYKIGHFHHFHIFSLLMLWLRFIARGVDGFRMDAVPFLFEDLQFRDEPLSGKTDVSLFLVLQQQSKAMDPCILRWRPHLSNFNFKT